jgi:hypothetical protein
MMDGCTAGKVMVSALRSEVQVLVLAETFVPEMAGPTASVGNVGAGFSGGDCWPMISRPYISATPKHLPQYFTIPPFLTST